MPHFKNTNDALFWLDEGEDPQKWLTSDCVQITDEEAQAIREAQNPAPSATQVRIAEIMARFIAIDTESIRPARAVSVYMASGEGEAPTEDINRLAALENEAKALRLELESLNA